MLRPAASSLALLMRRPLDSFWMLFERDMPVACRLRCASNASMLVLIRKLMVPMASYASSLCQVRGFRANLPNTSSAASGEALGLVGLQAAEHFQREQRVVDTLEVLQHLDEQPVQLCRTRVHVHGT